MARSVEVKVGDDGVVVTCPICGATIRKGWGRDGRLVWWPEEGDCQHFRGLYAGSRRGHVLALFG